ncbi:uncharacterized protein LOC122349400 [Puntigrus tetrazona]|uniref:uncharacterized protein LOC122349400 n=1 Tax=Puntigrus tetrazona TaxID=1606681 RepID=UPI001C89D690|nr:uncharacterized protein LOC122349400 [Puntigrus tetrazona]
MLDSDTALVYPIMHYVLDMNPGWKGDQLNICVRDGVRVSSSNRINHRFSLTEETSAGVFTVKIRDLREEDSGKYWCGEESSGSFIFTEVQLHVHRVSGFSVTALVSVGLVLLAVFLALVLFKIKRSRKHDVISSDRRETEGHQTDREEIQVSDPESPSSHPQSPLMGSCTPLSVSRSTKSLSVTLQSDSVKTRFTVIMRPSITASDQNNISTGYQNLSLRIMTEPLVKIVLFY